MKPFVRISGRAAPLPVPNIDTDQIIPARFVSAPGKKLGHALFYDLRFDGGGTPKSDFILNEPDYAGASILITGSNFGCGSSREHAPWALMDYGFRCVIAPSFADIFANNSVLNGLLLVSLPESEVEVLLAEAREKMEPFWVDLELQAIISPSGTRWEFEIDAVTKNKLLHGLDSIGETLLHEIDIAAFEERRAALASMQ